LEALIVSDPEIDDAMPSASTMLILIACCKPATSRQESRRARPGSGRLRVAGAPHACDGAALGFAHRAMGKIAPLLSIRH
jgi:hypothetical protein